MSRGVRVNIIAEGQTEGTFIRAYLAVELSVHGIFAVARRAETGRRGDCRT